jgi:hypothetical protein
MTRRAWLTLLFVLALLIGLPFLAMWDRARDQLPADAVRLEEPDAPRWWAEMVNTCLGKPIPYPARTRFYAAHSVPAGWLSMTDMGKVFGGYTDTGSGRVIVAPAWARDSAIIIHEALHVALGGGHPRDIYPSDTVPHCGIAPPGRGNR